MNDDIEVDELKKLVKDKLGIDLEGLDTKVFRSPLKKEEPSNNVKKSSMVIGQKTKEYNFDIKGIKVIAFDYERSQTPSSIASEIRNDQYGISKIEFKPGDIVVDLGANVGIFAMYLALKYPFIKIYSFEPSFVNYSHLLEGLKANRIDNVIAFNLAITKDGRDVISVASDQYSGGAMILEKGDIDVHQEVHYIVNDVSSTTVDKIFEENEIKDCKLLKIDIEGFEHEVIPDINVLSHIKYISGEFHYEGARDLLKHIKRFFTDPTINIKIEKPNMKRPKGAYNTLKKIKEVVSGKPDNVKPEIERLLDKKNVSPNNDVKVIAFNYIWPEYGIAFLEESIKAIISQVYEYHLFINEESYVGAKASDKSIKEVEDICDRMSKLGKIIIHRDGPSEAAKKDNISHYFKRTINLVKEYANYVWMVQSDEIYDKFSVEDVIDICNNNEIEACAVFQPICYFDTPHWFINPPEKFTRPTVINVSNPDFNKKKEFDIVFHHNSYVLTREELRLKFDNWGHREDVKKGKNRFWSIFDVIKTNKLLKNIHPIHPPTYSGVGFTNTQINRQMFLDWCYYLINHSLYDVYSKRYENVKNYDLSINQRKFVSSLISEMIPSDSMYLEIGTNFGWNLMLVSQIARDLTIIGFEKDDDIYQKTYQTIMQNKLLHDVSAFHGTPKFLIPKIGNETLDCIFINQNNVEDLKTSIIEVWPKMKNFSIMFGLYDRNNSSIVDLLNNTIDDTVRVQCPWGIELFRFHEIYKDIFKDIEEYKNVNLESDKAIWFARVRKS